MESEITTHIIKIKEYQTQHAEVAKSFHPELEKAIADARMKRQQLFRQTITYRENIPFVGAIYANGLQAQVMIYKMISNNKFFEVVAYDSRSKTYYFYTNHFFEQYAERVGIAHKKHLDILRHYVHHNPYIAFRYSNPHEEEHEGAMGYMHLGIMYGAKKAENIIVFKTFISHFHLTKEKQREAGKLRKKYVQASQMKMFS